MELISATELAQMFGVAKGTIWFWHAKGILPEPVKSCGRVDGWGKEDIANFIKQVKAPSSTGLLLS